MTKAPMRRFGIQVTTTLLTLCSLAGFGQTPCDPDPAMLDHSLSGDQTMDEVSFAFDAIFGPDYYAWQLCGDTIIVARSTVIYSYPECRIWMLNEKGRVKWSTDLSIHGGCKLMSLRPLPEKEFPQQVRRYNTLGQFEDKRIFMLAKRTGRMRHFTHEEINSIRTRDRNP